MPSLTLRQRVGMVPLLIQGSKDRSGLLLFLNITCVWT